ncbi:hypothetical protein SAMN04487983_100795 [Streptomyces sp. yr375]|uniref:hypothetical protein n=1 Tax=Streptomyces sp. yr375 TaxID=1761906 RepID=UPI0008D38CE9|nr:hypothetical protein [Streptomyces sp. yr375]SEQ68971.1 hypothetical protein SAMN04487983_100795 [Streptomyces sp. yr375]
MFRRLYEVIAGLRRKDVPAPDDWDVAREVRQPDPYVWPQRRLPDPYVWPQRRLPSPREARWRRWARRNRAAGHSLPFPREEACWRVPGRPGEPSWGAEDDVVRPYVLRP